MSRRIPFDIAAYERLIISTDCFICRIVAGETENPHHVIWEDDRYIAFLNRYPTLPGYLLVSPKRHLVDVVRDLDTADYLDLQAVVHRVARAAASVLPTERVYLMSLGSMQGNAHIHWHVACLPPEVPYPRQQFHALMAENGVLDQTADEMAAIAAGIRSAM
ncbi:histidine triad (HIT) family protein/ATP adenylyltransferase [Stackebrandtia endophytica]|uniref:Histidine triad (HIT) family protein/ATP adenylyltransferase n=1 Tax=Stackebrandtia endophytica TaxID=1496996 RepID=A0A543ATQ2_9ACTN|nr:HIT family protein [Stackebrandtia endophytica]TQL75974.1 histidine triad (HIT) family protein/ATP adenylyltransferase [Stackebrandtia endophytica]